MYTVENITQDKVEVKPIWGGFKVETTATVIVKGGHPDHVESYTITFNRDQITGVVNGIVCLPRIGRTTEYTLTPQAIKELVEDELT